MLSFLSKWLTGFLLNDSSLCLNQVVFQDAFRSAPERLIDFEGRKSLTRPPSPKPLLTSDSDNAVVQPSTINVLPREIREQIWRNIVKGHTFHLRMTKKRFTRQVCNAKDPSCYYTCRWGCRPLPVGQLRRKKNCCRCLLRVNQCTS